ncbi:MAG: phospholipid carrier-dependent glycosyltransferase [Anaerolineae bacterium]
MIETLRAKLPELDPSPYKALIQNKSSAFVFLFVGLLNFLFFTLKEIVTPDEFAWVIQSIHFRQALIEQDWPNLVQSAHPGFITMWIGAIGTTVKLWFRPDLQPEIDWILQQSWHLPQTGELSARLHPFLQPARNTLSLLMAALWTAVYALLKQRTKPIVAFGVIMLLTTDMWIIGLTNILHVDGLLAMFCLLTLLLVLPRRDDELAFYGQQRYLLAGVTMAGAILSKVPGLLLTAIVPTILFVQWWFLCRAETNLSEDGFAPQPNRARLSRLLLLKGIALLIGLLATFAIFAPIIFIDLNYVFQNVFVLSAREVGFSAPTFFMGWVRENPTILFYPFTILFRQRALITFGLIFATFRYFRTRDNRKQTFFLAAVGAFCLLFWMGLLVSDREFARYALPIYLLITFIGAISFAQFLIEAVTSRYFKQTKGYRFFSILSMALIIWNIFFYHKDPFTHINYFVGGPQSGPSLMLTGWGGAQSLAANRLGKNQNRTIFTDNVPATAPFVSNPDLVFLLTPQTAWLVKPEDEVILSLEFRQLNRELWEPPYAESEQSNILRHIVKGEHIVSIERYGGSNRAWVYSNFDQWQLNKGLKRYTSTGFTFNNSLRLIEAVTIKPHDDFNIHLLLRWTLKQPESGILQFTIVDAADSVWIQREDPLINIEEIPAGNWTQNTTYLSTHTLPLASDMPPGDYSVRVSHFRPDGSLSGITHDQEFIGTTATLATFPVTVPAPQPPVAIPESTIDHSTIKAIAELPATIGQGETITADVWVKQNESLGEGFNLLLETGRQSLIYPVDSTNWQEGFIYRVRARWQIPADLTPGEQLLRLNGVDLGTLIVETRERNFDIPVDVPTSGSGLMFGDVLRLVVVEPKIIEQNSVRIVWQANSPNQIDYAIFIHLKDAAGNILAQQDMQPGKPTSQTIQNEVVDFTAEIPLGNLDPADVSTIAIGFYNPATGQRLPVLNNSGERLPNDQAEIIIEADDN